MSTAGRDNGEMTSSPQRLSTYGAVDLSAFNRPSPPPGAQSPTDAPASGHPYVIDVTEATFEPDVIVRSATVPVVVDFWAEWCEPCKQLSPILERMARADEGRWLLARIDVDANQRLAGAAGVQSIPLVLGVIAGQALPLFNGALPEAEVRRYLDELLRVAVANGVSGRLPAAPANDIPSDAPSSDADDTPPEAAPDPYGEAAAMLAEGDLDGAAAAFETVLANRPGDPDATQGLALVAVARRASVLDRASVLAAAAAAPDDVNLQRQAADLELAEGDAEAAFRRLVEVVRRTAGDERDAARTHLVGLFEAVGPADPLVVAARTALANALF